MHLSDRRKPNPVIPPPVLAAFVLVFRRVFGICHCFLASVSSRESARALNAVFCYVAQRSCVLQIPRYVRVHRAFLLTLATRLQRGWVLRQGNSPNHPVVLGHRFEETAPRVSLLPSSRCLLLPLLPPPRPCLCLPNVSVSAHPAQRFVAP